MHACLASTRSCFLIAVWLIVFDRFLYTACGVPAVNTSAQHTLNSKLQFQLLQLLSELVPSIQTNVCRLNDVYVVSVAKWDDSVTIRIKVYDNPESLILCPFLNWIRNDTLVKRNLSDPAFVFIENTNDHDHPGLLPISIKQTIVFAVCGVIISGFFIVAAIMRFRNRLRKTLHKRRLIEKEAKKINPEQKVDRRKPDILDPLAEMAAYESNSQREVSAPDVGSLTLSASLASLVVDNHTPSPLTPNSYGTPFFSQTEPTVQECENVYVDTVRTASLATPEHDFLPQHIDGSELTQPKSNQHANDATSSENKLVVPSLLPRRLSRPLCKSLSYQSGVSYKLQRLSPSQLASSLPNQNHPAINNFPFLNPPPISSKSGKLTPVQRHQLLSLQKRFMEESLKTDKYFQGKTVYNVELHRLKRVNTISSDGRSSTTNGAGPSTQNKLPAAPTKHPNFASFKRIGRRQSSNISTEKSIMMADYESPNSDIDM